MNKEYVDIALREAAKSTCKHKLGCLAIARGKVISKGFNRYQRSPGETHRKGEHTIHAEQIALRRTGGISIDTIFVVRATVNGLTMAAPCKRCHSLAKRAGVKYIYYTDWLGNIQKYKV